MRQVIESKVTEANQNYIKVDLKQTKFVMNSEHKRSL